MQVDKMLDSLFWAWHNPVPGILHLHCAEAPCCRNLNLNLSLPLCLTSALPLALPLCLTSALTLTLTLTLGLTLVPGTGDGG